MKQIEFIITGLVSDSDFENINYLVENKDLNTVLERFLQKTIGYTFDFKSNDINLVKNSQKNCLKLFDESCYENNIHKYIISRFIDDNHEDYFFAVDLNKNIIYNSDKNTAQKFDTIEMAKKAFEFLKDNKQLVQVKNKSNAEFSIIDIITGEPIYYILTDKTVFSMEIDGRL